MEDKDITTISPPPLVRFISIWKAVANGGKKFLSSIKLAIFNANNLYYFKLEQ